jgi:hypothetical protein
MSVTTNTPKTNACYARAGMMLSLQVDELHAECHNLEIENARLREAIKNTVTAWDRIWKPGMEMQPHRLPHAIQSMRDILANTEVTDTCQNQNTNKPANL